MLRLHEHNPSRPNAYSMISMVIWQLQAHIETLQELEGMWNSITRFQSLQKERHDACLKNTWSWQWVEFTPLLPRPWPGLGDVDPNWLTCRQAALPLFLDIHLIFGCEEMISHQYLNRFSWWDHATSVRMHNFQYIWMDTYRAMVQASSTWIAVPTKVLWIEPPHFILRKFLMSIHVQVSNFKVQSLKFMSHKPISQWPYNM